MFHVVQFELCQTLNSPISKHIGIQYIDIFLILYTRRIKYFV